MQNFPGVGTDNEMDYWAGIELGETSAEGVIDPHPPQLGGLQMGPSPQMTWATNEPLEQHSAIPWPEPHQNPASPPHRQWRNPPLTEPLWDGTNTLQTTRIVDARWSKSGGRSVSETIPGCSRKTLGPWGSSISGSEPAGILERGAVFVSEAEAPQPGEFEESHLIGASGGREEGMVSQGYESQEACGNWQRQEDWLQFDPLRRDSLLDNQMLTEAVFLEREIGSTAGKENSRQKSDCPRTQPSKNKKETHTCLECGKGFAYKSNLIRHEHSHSGEKPYTCLECGKSFSRQTYLSNHERVHTGEKPYVCSVCGKDFVARSNLLQHQNIHTGEKPYRCMECGKSFRWSSQLVAHSALHREEAPFRCLECGRSFNWENNLRVHMKSHDSKGLQIPTRSEKS